MLSFSRLTLIILDVPIVRGIIPVLSLFFICIPYLIFLYFAAYQNEKKSEPGAQQTRVHQLEEELKMVRFL